MAVSKSDHIKATHTWTSLLPHIKKYRFGLGLLGEQETENLNQTMTKIEQWALGIVNSVQKQVYINKANILHSSQGLQHIK